MPPISYSLAGQLLRTPAPALLCREEEKGWQKPGEPVPGAHPLLLTCRSPGSGSREPAWSRAGVWAFLSRTTSMHPAVSIWNS